MDYTEEQDILLKDLSLSVRSFNALRRFKITTLNQLCRIPEEELYQIPGLGKKSVEELLQLVCDYKCDSEKFLTSYTQPIANTLSFDEWLNIDTNKAHVISLLQEQGTLISDLPDLSVNAFNLLFINGYEELHQIAFTSEEELLRVPRMTSDAAAEISACTRRYLNENHALFCDVEEQVPTQQQHILNYVRKHDIRIDSMQIGTRARNCLNSCGHKYMSDILFLSDEELYQIKNMGKLSVEQIIAARDNYLALHKDRIDTCLSNPDTDIEENPSELEEPVLSSEEYQEKLRLYVRVHDVPVTLMDISNRARNALVHRGYTAMSDILSLSYEQISGLQNLGESSVSQIIQARQGYLELHHDAIAAIMQNTDPESMIDDQTLQKQILHLFDDAAFSGLNLKMILEQLNLPVKVSDSRIKAAVGELISAHQLEYADYYYYRVYPKFCEYFNNCSALNDRNREMIKLRLDGKTLKEIAESFGLTREGVRQLVNRSLDVLRAHLMGKTGLKYFDEDFYQYFYCTYEFNARDAEHWLGIPASTWLYLESACSSRGKQDIVEAAEDPKLPPVLRTQVQKYLNRNHLWLDGTWVSSKRADLEVFIAKRICSKEARNYTDFATAYNHYLQTEGISFDEDIYLTSSVINTRRKHLSESRYILWSLNEKLRYYDIDSKDYTELIEGLSLDTLENIALSTKKLFGNYPELMRAYDIRDHYELHNLLRKAIPEGSLNDFHCTRMPIIQFGTFDRDSAIMDLLIEHAPIEATAFAEIISEEYGYDTKIILSTYLVPFKAYYHRGIYSIDQKVMPLDRMQRLQSVLTEDFYYLSEIRNAYLREFPQGDIDEINPYTLKSMGFTVLSNHVLQNYTSLEAYFHHLLTHNEVTDLAPLRKRFTYVSLFSNVLMELRRDLEIIEFDPGKLIAFHKLEKAGITKVMLRNFCREVCAFAENEEYFTIHSLKHQGFRSELFDLGFSDLFYSSLLLSEERLGSIRAFNNLIFFLDNSTRSNKAWICSLIRAHGSIDVFDLINEIIEVYGCDENSIDKWDIMQAILDTEIYHDRILDRLYANVDLYYHELDEIGGF